MTTTATHLFTCARHWPDLAEAVAQPAIHGGFGIGLRGHLAALADDDQQEYDRWQAAALRALERDPIQLGQRPIPIRLAILDTMTLVETALLDLADQTAALVQRSPMPHAPRTWPTADRARRNQLADADATDRRRWQYVGRRTAPRAALWLLARVQGQGGPFTALSEQQHARIARTAADAAGRVERALDIASQQRTLERRCGCGGQIDVYGGAGVRPTAHCTGCGRVWAEGVIAA